MRIAKKIVFLVSIVVLARCGPTDDATKNVSWVETSSDMSDLLAPVNLQTLCNGPTIIRLNWEVADTAATHISIERKSETEDFVAIGQVEANVATFEDETVKMNVQYIYRVQAMVQDAEGNASYVSEYSDEVAGMADDRCEVIDDQSSSFSN